MFRINWFPHPFKGVLSYLRPLEKWGMDSTRPPGDHFHLREGISLPEEIKQFLSSGNQPLAIVPSAAWEMKRWPVAYWKELVLSLQSERFLVLGGPEDQFCEDIARVAPNRVLNCAGKTTLQESALLLARSWLTISADTGLLHVADQMEKPCIALIGPTAFGYPTSKSSIVLETQLHCKPCTKDGSGRCRNLEYQKCLLELTPSKVSELVLKLRAQRVLNSS
jgi:heptosyltransferase-2